MDVEPSPNAMRLVANRKSSAVPREWTKTEIDDEMRQNGVKVDVNTFGNSALRLIGFEFEMSLNIARGQFVVGENAADSNGEMIRGLAEYIAETLGSAAGSFAAETHRVVGLELNVNHLQSAFVGQKVTAIAKALKNGSNVQVWEIRLETGEGETEPKNERVLIAVGRLTLMVQTSAAMDKLAARAKL